VPDTRQVTLAARFPRTGSPAVPRRPFLLYGQARAGGNLLGSLLASHPSVHMAPELLASPGRRPERALERERRRHRGRHVGVRAEADHLLGHGLRPASWLAQASARGWLVVHVERRDTLRHVLASMRRPLFAVDPAQLLADMEHRAALCRAERADLRGVEHLTVCYEDDVLPAGEAWQRVTDRVFAALGLASTPVATRARHVADLPLSSLIGNPDEVTHALRGTRFAHLASRSELDRDLPAG
jgi:hypothetical protein